MVKKLFGKSGPKEVEGKVVEETDMESAAGELNEYCGRLKDDLKQELDASIQPMEGPYEDRLHAFFTHLDQLDQQDKMVGARWMPLSDIYSNVRRYGNDVVAAAVITKRVEWGTA